MTGGTEHDVGPRLVIDRQEDRMVVALDHPATRNAIDLAMVDELHAVCTELEADPRVLILTGRGGVFASGADIAQLRERGRADALAGINSTIFERIAKLPLPVIAAVEGYALGGGAELALAADFRIAADDAVFGNPETGLGILAAAGATWRLREVIGEPLAKEVLLAGRRLDAKEALAAHLVTEVHPAAGVLDAAHRLADRILRSDPLALRLTKSVFHAPREAHPLVDVLAQSTLFESPGKAERMDDFLTKREERRRARAQRSDADSASSDHHPPKGSDS